MDSVGVTHFEVRDPGVNLLLGEQTNTSRMQQPFTRMAVSAMAGESGRDLEGYRDYRGVPVIGSWLWSDRLGFGMTTKIDIEEAYSALNFNRKSILISIDLLVILTFIFFGFLIKYLNKYRGEARNLIQNEQTMRLLNSAGEAIYGIDLDGKCTFANKACLKLLGYHSEDELLSENIHDLIHLYSHKDGTLYPVDECKEYLAFQSGIASHIDNEVLRRKDGGCFPAEYRSDPIFCDEKIIGTVVSFADITERLDAEEKERLRFNRVIGLKDAMADIVLYCEAIEEEAGIDSIQHAIIKNWLYVNPSG